VLDLGGRLAGEPRGEERHDGHALAGALQGLGATEHCYTRGDGGEGIERRNECGRSG
jgi:hypothetical protein